MNFLLNRPDPDTTCSGYQYRIVFIMDSAGFGSGSYLYRLLVRIYYRFGRIQILSVQDTGTN
jgi:hypothetical protein